MMTFAYRSTSYSLLKVFENRQNKVVNINVNSHIANLNVYSKYILLNVHIL